MTAREAAALADAFVEELRATEALTRAAYPVVFDAVRDLFVTAALAGDSPLLASNSDTGQNLKRLLRRDPHAWRRIQFAAQDAAVRRLWQRNRIVYDIDVTLWAELGDTDTSTAIPTDLFAHLPHPDPFIAFPEPLLLPVDAHTRQRVRGFFVRGAGSPANEPDASTDEHVHMSTHHRAATHLGLTFGGTVENLDGTPSLLPTGEPDMIWSRVTLDPRIGQHTVGEMITAALARFHGQYGGGEWENNVPLMLRRAVTLLVYLCATNVDLTPLPRQTTAVTGKARGRTKTKPLVPWGVGYRVGAELRAYYRREHPEPATPTGRRTRPHVRRAHFHTYWTGPKGAQTAKVKWLSPIPVNFTGDAERSTVIPVRRQPSLA